MTYPTAHDAVESDYNQFWRDAVETDGEMDPEKVKRELHDYHMVMQYVSRVYDSLTGGRISKPNTLPVVVIGEVNERFARIYGEEAP